MASTVTPIRTKDLVREQGRPRIGSVVSPHRDSAADGLTPTRLAQIMRRADEGDVEAYLTLAQEMEERDCHYRSVLHTRKMAVSGIPPQVELPDDSPDMAALGEAVERHVVLTPLFEGLVYDLLDAIGKGFSCVEIVWRKDPAMWLPVGYEFREQRHFIFDQDALSTPLLRTDDPVAAFPEQGVPLRPYQWIVHRPKLGSGVPIRTGLARTVAVAYAAKRWTCADWMAFLDLYGVPIRVGKYPTVMAPDKGVLLKAVLALGSDAAAVIPKEMEIELLEARASGGAEVFERTVNYWDKQVSKAVVGQTMSSDDGSSLSQAKVHEQVRWDIRDADARHVAATIDAQLIQPFVTLNFGARDVYPRLRLSVKRPDEVLPMMQAAKLFVDLGGKLQASEVRDRLGFMEPEEGAELLSPRAAPQQPPPGNGAAPPPDDNEEPPPNDDEEPAGDDDEVEPDERQLNRERPLSPTDDDAVDEVAAQELADWHTLAGTNVGRIVSELGRAPSFEAARSLLAELAKDEGEVLDIGALVVSLARATFTLRGVGDATDDVAP